jgi:hypothetical protein
MHGFVIPFSVIASSLSGFLWPKYWFLAVVFLAPRSSTLVWRFDFYTALTRLWQTPIAASSAVLSQGFSKGFSGGIGVVRE